MRQLNGEKSKDKEKNKLGTRCSYKIVKGTAEKMDQLRGVMLFRDVL